MKNFLFAIVFAVVVGSQAYEEELKCNFRICGSELLNFHDYSISSIFKKIEYSSFCIKNCTPPVVHEFFQSIRYALTKRIPGHCAGHDCASKNRFVALSKCVHEKAWPLLQCSKRLVDLAQVAFEVKESKQRRNYTCSITVESTQCIEEILQECGTYPFTLAKDIFIDVVKQGISAYCPRNKLTNDFFIEHMTTTLAPYQDRLKTFTDISPAPGDRPYPQFVKGYRIKRDGDPDDNGAPTQSVSLACVAAGLVLSLYMNRR
ncbi:hypothetical protein JTE90_029503 [Oedothorax gibbosus]|uniref:Uncharacterized protein n=1 Tax=Oedothorax gibbosus TaxID=931172 RepID=A0AAV6UG71_9ARAC|nr:hypothetical protein JTE90_029503 [Oedothorax gibbosus]